MDQSRPEDIGCAQEQEMFRQKASRMQFLQNVFSGIGGALLFGTVSSLILGGGAVAATLPFWAIIAIPAVGIGLMFMGTRFGIESQLLSQRLGAKLVGSAVKPTLGVAPEPVKEPTKTLPPGMNGLTRDADKAEQEQMPTPAEAEKPGHKVHAMAALERLDQSGRAAAIQ